MPKPVTAAEGMTWTLYLPQKQVLIICEENQTNDHQVGEITIFYVQEDLDMIYDDLF